MHLLLAYVIIDYEEYGHDTYSLPSAEASKTNNAIRTHHPLRGVSCGKTTILKSIIT